MVKLSGEVSASDDVIGSGVFDDLAVLASTIPGLVQLEWQSEEAFRGRMKIKIPVGMMTSRITGEVTRDASSIAIRLKGNAVNVAGGFDANVTLTAGPGQFVYELTVQFSGWLASLGEGLLTPIMAAKAREFEKNLTELIATLS